MDEEWFEEHLPRPRPSVHRYLVRRAPTDAEDLAAEVMTIAWRRRAHVPAGAELPWLYRTAGYVLANHRRRRIPTPTGHTRPRRTTSTPPSSSSRTRPCAPPCRLAPRDRRILLLHAWEGLGAEDLAAVLGITLGGADAALSRARARLAAAWDA